MNRYQHTIRRAAFLGLLVGLTTTLSACSSGPKPTEDKTVTQSKFKGELQEIDALEGVEVLGEQDGVRAMKISGMTVLHKATKANDVVSAQLYFIGGAQRLSPETSGIERLALAASVNGGTTSTPKDAFNAKLDSVGASIGSFTDRDYSGVSMKTVTPYFDQVWDLFAQVITEPAIPEGEIELIRQRQLAQIDALLESPDSQVSHLATQSLFQGHPYATLQLGTRPVVSKLQRPDLVAWQKSLLVPKQMVLVVVGNVPTKEIAQKVSTSFAKLPQAAVEVPPVPKLSATAPKLEFAQRKLPTNYVFGLFTAPAPGEKDYAPMVMAMDYLSDRLFEEVRSKRKLTYAVSAGISDRRANYGYLYVTAKDPKVTLEVMFDEVKNLKTELMTEQALKETLNVYLTNHYMGQETNSSQAAELGDAYILTGDWRSALTFLAQMQSVKPEDVKRVVNTYMKNFHFAVVGPDESKLPKDLMNQ